MNVKLQQKDVFCLVNNYEQVYSLITKQINVSGLTFCKRQAGAGYLQWTLPDGDWTALTKAPDSEQELIRQQFYTMSQAVRSKFGSNEKLAQAVLSIPSEEHVFYQCDINGHLQLALTAWGYKFPDRPDGDNIKGRATPPVEQQMVRLCFVYDAEKLPNMPFTLITYKRITDETGLFTIGMQPVGKELPVTTDDGHAFTLKVEKGLELYVFDLTEYVTIEVGVHKDGDPLVGASCSIDYNGHAETFETDITGSVSVKWPFCKKGADCIVKMDDQVQSKAVSLPKASFLFEIVTPKEPEKPKEPEEPITPQPPITPPTPEEPPVNTDLPVEPPVVSPSEPKMVRFRLLGYKGIPLPELEFTIKTKKNGILTGVTDDNGYAEFPANLFTNGERPKIKFTITKEYQKRHDIYAKPPKK